MINTDKYEGHTPAPWYRMHSNDTIRSEPMGDDAEAYLFDIVGATTVDAELAADAPLLLEEVKRLRKALHVEEQIVQAFYEYRMECCFDHCEAWMLEKGHRVLVKTGDDEHSEWAVEMD